MLVEVVSIGTSVEVVGRELTVTSETLRLSIRDASLSSPKIPES